MTLDQHAEWSLQMLEAVGFVICVLNDVCCKSLLIIHTTSVNYKQNGLIYKQQIMIHS